jgi:hypothetical protein
LKEEVGRVKKEGRRKEEDLRQLLEVVRREKDALRDKVKVEEFGDIVEVGQGDIATKSQEGEEL